MKICYSALTWLAHRESWDAQAGTGHSKGSLKLFVGAAGSKTLTRREKLYSTGGERKTGRLASLALSRDTEVPDANNEIIKLLKEE